MAQMETLEYFLATQLYDGSQKLNVESLGLCVPDSWKQQRQCATVEEP